MNNEDFKKTIGKTGEYVIYFNVNDKPIVYNVKLKRIVQGIISIIELNVQHDSYILAVRDALQFMPGWELLV